MTSLSPSLTDRKKRRADFDEYILETASSRISELETASRHEQIRALGHPDPAMRRTLFLRRQKIHRVGHTAHMLIARMAALDLSKATDWATLSAIYNSDLEDALDFTLEEVQELAF